MNQFPSLYERYVPLTDIVPIPTLERTQAEIRDRAVSDANVLRQEVAELRAALRWAMTKLSAPDARSTEASGPYDYCVQYDRARALLTKVSR